MKKYLIILLFISGSLSAQLNRASLGSYINTNVYPNTVNAVTPTMLNNVLTTQNNSYANLLSDTNLLGVRLFTPYFTYTPGMGVFYGDTLFMDAITHIGTWNRAHFIKIIGAGAVSDSGIAAGWGEKIIHSIPRIISVDTSKVSTIANINKTISIDTANFIVSWNRLASYVSQNTIDTGTNKSALSYYEASILYLPKADSNVYKNGYSSLFGLHDSLKGYLQLKDSTLKYITPHQLQAGTNITLTRTSGTITIAASGGGSFTGSIQSHQIAFGKSPNEISGSNNLEWEYNATNEDTVLTGTEGWLDLNNTYNGASGFELSDNVGDYIATSYNGQDIQLSTVNSDFLNLNNNFNYINSLNNDNLLIQNGYFYNDSYLNSIYTGQWSNTGGVDINGQFGSYIYIDDIDDGVSLKLFSNLSSINFGNNIQLLTPTQILLYGEEGVDFINLTQTEINNIASPSSGSLVYNSTTSVFNYYNGSAWQALAGGGGVDTGSNKAALSVYQASLTYIPFADTSASSTWTKKVSSIYGLHDSLTNYLQLNDTNTKKGAATIYYVKTQISDTAATLLRQKDTNVVKQAATPTFVKAQITDSLNTQLRTGVDSVAAGSSVITFNGLKLAMAMDSTTSSATALTVVWKNVINGGRYVWIWNKTTSSNLTLTFPAHTAISQGSNGTPSGNTCVLVSTATGKFVISMYDCNGDYITFIAQNQP